MWVCAGGWLWELRARLTAARMSITTSLCAFQGETLALLALPEVEYYVFSIKEHYVIFISGIFKVNQKR